MLYLDKLILTWFYQLALFVTDRLEVEWKASSQKKIKTQFVSWTFLKNVPHPFCHFLQPFAKLCGMKAAWWMARCGILTTSPSPPIPPIVSAHHISSHTLYPSQIHICITKLIQVLENHTSGSFEVLAQNVSSHHRSHAASHLRRPDTMTLHLDCVYYTQ